MFCKLFVITYIAIKSPQTILRLNPLHATRSQNNPAYRSHQGSAGTMQSPAVSVVWAPVSGQ